MSAVPEQPTERTTAIAEYSATEAALSDLKSRYGNLVADAKTKEGMTVLVKGRAELRTLRTTLEAKREELKKPILERGRLLDSEAKRITAELLALEEPIDAQIKAEETRKAREKAEAEERERKHTAEIHERIAAISAIVSHVGGRNSAAIEEKIKEVEALTITEELFGPFIATAREAHAKTIATLRLLHGGTLAREREAAEAKAKADAEREELARLRREEEDRRMKARAEEEARALARQQEEAKERAAREAEAAERRKAEEAEMAERRAKIEEEERAAATARAKAEAEEAVARKAREEAEELRRQAERERLEFEDGEALLKRFLERFGTRREFAHVCNAIRKHFTTKPQEAKP